MKKTMMRMLVLTLSFMLAVSGINLSALAENAPSEEAQGPAGEESLQGTANEGPLETPAEEPPKEVANETAPPVIYQITFMWFDESTICPVEAGMPIEKPLDDPRMEGVIFLYWYDAEDPEQLPFAFDLPAVRDVVLAPMFEAVPADEPVPGDEEAADAEAAVDAEAADDAPESEEASEWIVSYTFSVAAGDRVQYGDEISFYAHVEGNTDIPHHYQWQVLTPDGWADIPGEKELVFSFVLNAETAVAEYNLIVIADDSTSQQAEEQASALLP